MSAFECSKCGKVFDTKKGRGVHESLADHSKPWNDPKALEREYVEKEQTTTELAEKWDCTYENVLKNLREFGIERRSVGEQLSGRRDKKATYRIDENGYSGWIANDGGNGPDVFYVHRLLAIAEYGVEAVKDKQVHHRNGVKWDNRPENIEVVSQTEHLRIKHAMFSPKEKAELAKAYLESRLTYKQVADKYGVGKRTAKSYVRQYRDGELDDYLQ